MSSGFDEVEVFADRLQAAGDPRGSLLTMELAAERAVDAAEARRLNAEAQRLRLRHSALVWPASLRGPLIRIRAGFMVAGSVELAAALPMLQILGHGVGLRDPSTWPRGPGSGPLGPWRSRVRSLSRS